MGWKNGYCNKVIDFIITCYLEIDYENEEVANYNIGLHNMNILYISS